jgi:phage tail-like protein
MAKFTVNSNRFDPYRNFKFKVKIDGQVVAGLSKCSPMKKTVEVAEWYESGDVGPAHKLPGKTKFDPITLSAGVTHDTTFEDWANLINVYGSDGMSLKNYRKDIAIEVFNLQGSKILAYNVYKCWVSEYQALPELDASANAIMIQTIKLENEGWERDTEVKEPVEK